MRGRLDWQFHWLTTWDEVWSPSFIAQWKKWIEDSSHAHVFFEPSMVRAWVKHFQTLEHIEPRFLIAEHVSGSKVLYPLVLVRYGWKDSWIRVLEPPGEESFDYMEPLYTETNGSEVFPSFWSSAIEEIQERLGWEVDQVILHRVRESCVGSYQGFHEQVRAPFIDLRGIADIDTLLANVSKKLRRDIQRQVRRLEELGDLQLRVYRGDELSSAMGALDGLIHAYRVKWRAPDSAGNLWKEMLQECLHENFFHISVLESHGVPISWHLGFLHKRRFYHYKLAFDAGFENYSPGKVHRTKLVEESLRRGATVFDFLRGEEEYKDQWTQKRITLYRLGIDGPRFRSQFALRARRVLWANRQRYRRLCQRFRHVK
jgi:CelD/BcsL family acetyltransferase involved in cellulose biosynthesis